ncbi:MAG TPA: ClbS/DfsB family four-helix bundle protein [Methylomirabilota bacterium]|nr:ClbS/DfsB family four-helix bundle protein [Methylomirabilota bacterium]
MSEKQKLLAEAEAEFAKFKQAIAGLSDAQMREVWCGVWGVREIVSHLSGWHREMGPLLERLARGERPVPEGVSYEDVDGWNAKFADAKKSWSTAEILTELDASHPSFMKAAAAVPEERFVPGKTAYRVVDLNSRHHYQEHGDQIRAWRKSRGI